MQEERVTDGTNVIEISNLDINVFKSALEKLIQIKDTEKIDDSIKGDLSKNDELCFYINDTGIHGEGTSYHELFTTVWTIPQKHNDKNNYTLSTPLNGRTIKVCMYQGKDYIKKTLKHIKGGCDLSLTINSDNDVILFNIKDVKNKLGIKKSCISSDNMYQDVNLSIFNGRLNNGDVIGAFEISGKDIKKLIELGSLKTNLLSDNDAIIISSDGDGIQISGGSFNSVIQNNTTKFGEVVIKPILLKGLAEESYKCAIMENEEGRYIVFRSIETDTQAIIILGEKLEQLDYDAFSDDL